MAFGTSRPKLGQIPESKVSTQRSKKDTILLGVLEGAKHTIFIYVVIEYKIQKYIRMMSQEAVKTS